MAGRASENGKWSAVCSAGSSDASSLLVPSTLTYTGEAGQWVANPRERARQLDVASFVHRPATLIEVASRYYKASSELLGTTGAGDAPVGCEAS